MQKTHQTSRHHRDDSKCIWMQAGVVRFKTCNLDYDCWACQFNKALYRIAIENKELRQQGRTPEGKRGQINLWSEQLMSLPLNKRPCVHHMKNRIGFRSCTNEYRCSDCEFDQYFQDEFMVHTVMKPVSVLQVEGVKIPQGYYLHRGHTWAKLEENSEVRIGIDDFAMRVFGPPDRIDSPLVGKTVEQNQAAISINRDDRLARVLSPVSGVVTAVNPKLREEGDVANRQPYDEGWVLRVHCTNLRRDLKQLMLGKETATFIEDEVDRIYTFIESKAGPLAADGGYLANDIYGNIPQLGWDSLATQFLHT